MNEFSKLIKELRGEESLRSASKRIKISHNYLRVLEMGTDPQTKAPIKPTHEVIKKIAKAYNYPYLDLAEKAGIISLEDKEKAIEIKKTFDSISFCELLVVELKFFPENRMPLLISQLNLLKDKYKELLGDSFNFTIDDIRELGRELAKSGTAQDFMNFSMFYDDVMDLINKANPKPYSDSDLYYELKNPLLYYKNVELTDEDKINLINYLEFILRDRIPL